MKAPLILGLLAISISVNACGQNKDKQDVQQETTSKNTIMDLSNITHPTVKSAIAALQSGDASWYGFFTENPLMTDDGNPVNFKSFFSNALGQEHFLSIDKVENDGKDIYGDFKAGSWGTFKVFFKFHINEDGLFYRLDIGQAKY